MGELHDVCVLFFQSLKSCGYVKEQFAWRHFYWYLTNEGIQYLRDFLHLPPEIVPATLRRQTRPETARPRPKGKIANKLITLVVVKCCWDWSQCRNLQNTSSDNY